MTQTQELPDPRRILLAALQHLENGTIQATDIVIVLLDREILTFSTNVLYSPMPQSVVSDVLSFASVLTRPKVHPLIVHACSQERMN